MPPLAHAMRLIDDEETDRAREEMLEERTILETLGSEVKYFSLALCDLTVRLSRLGGREVRVHRDGAHSLRGELVVLVFHQGDERADDDRKTGQQQRGQLVDQGFPAAGRHHHQGVLSRENGIERLPLARSEILMPKAILQELASRLPRYLYRHSG